MFLAFGWNLIYLKRWCYSKLQKFEDYHYQYYQGCFWKYCCSKNVILEQNTKSDHLNFGIDLILNPCGPLLFPLRGYSQMTSSLEGEGHSASTGAQFRIFWNWLFSSYFTFLMKQIFRGEIQYFSAEKWPQKVQKKTGLDFLNSLCVLGPWEYIQIDEK